jgi:hypothetical protein
MILLLKSYNQKMAGMEAKSNKTPITL